MDPEAPTARMGPDVARCTATTQAGNPCPRAVQPGTTLCWTHGTPLEERRVIAGLRNRKASPVAGAATTEEAEAIAAELAQAEDAAAIRGVLAKVASLVLTGRITPRVAAAVAQVAGQALKALAQDHSKAMRELHEILDRHQSPEVQGWSRRRNRPAGHR
jgi:hypothetical protein